jgi:hypothetical protein
MDFAKWQTNFLHTEVVFDIISNNLLSLRKMFALLSLWLCGQFAQNKTIFGICHWQASSIPTIHIPIHFKFQICIKPTQQTSIKHFFSH